MTSQMAVMSLHSHGSLPTWFSVTSFICRIPLLTVGMCSPRIRQRLLLTYVLTNITSYGGRFWGSPAIYAQGPS